ncbi:fimbria/pilus outer membrane usher protein [Providencia sp. PROV032]|uniref:fimbria/pilus outer membrane usher protein n=1 Tax=Providencia sp. PROV032 TaxID=2949764 RepID=UPI002349372A|nr:fimbria/pilus outer membrane usher protein [Providencia sp. PROV032]
MKIKKYILPALFIFFANETTYANETKSSNDRFKTSFLTYLGHNENIILDEVKKPGRYYVDIYVNHKKIGLENINFKNANGELKPCFSQKDLDKLKLNYEMVFLERERLLDCTYIDELLNGAYTEYNDEEEKLSINIPQIYISTKPEDYISPEQWSKGVNSYAISYDMNYTNIRQSNYNNMHLYRGYFNQHLNLSSWHIYTSNVLTAKSNKATKNRFNDLYAEHPIASLKSALTIGEMTTDSQYFSWAKYRGAKLASDKRMEPTSLSGFAPVIRGIANTPSLLSVEYNGRVIYEKNIPAGEYNITDLPITYGNGSLDIILTNVEGERTVQEIPVSTISNLLRPGKYEYSVDVGELDMNYSQNYWLTQGIIKYGVNNNLTIYSGVQTIFPNDYMQAMVGGTINSSIGGMSMEYSRSKSDVKRALDSSCSVFCNDKIRMSYENDIHPLDIYFSLSMSRYLDENYLELDQFLTEKQVDNNRNFFINSSQKQLTDISISKNLPEGFGSISMSGYYSQPWSSNYKDNYSYSIGFNNQYKRINYNISIFRYKNNMDKIDNTLYLSASIPIYTKNKNVNLSSSYSNSSNGYNTRVAASINEKTRNASSINIWTDKNSNTTPGFGLSVENNNGYNTKSVGYSQSNNSKMLYGNMKGAVVLHSGGINRVSNIGKTYSIIKAVGAEGMKVSSNSNIEIAGNGYGIYPNLSPYKKNYILLDSKKSKNNAEIEDNNLMVIPVSGSSPLVEFKVNKVFDKILKIKSDKYKIPFGTKIIDGKNNSLGITDQSGFVFISEPNINEVNENPWKAVWSLDGEKYECILNTDDLKKDISTTQSQIDINCY